MDTAKQAAEVLSATERKLRELVGAAAGSGDYETAGRIMMWAKSIGALANGSHAEPSLLHDPPRAEPQAPLRRSRRTPANGQYPRFFRRGDQLIKIGWSKKERAEYEHKAPRRVIDSLAAAIARRSGNGKLFTVEELFPLKDPHDGSEIPAYQGYVALAWLKSTGLVKQMGRRGYSVKSVSRLPDAIVASWQQLAEASV